MRKLLLAGLLLLAPTVVWAQGNTNTVPPSCALATLGTCVPAIQGTVVRLSDAASAADCTAGGGDGTTPATCVYNGSAWTLLTGTYSGASGNTITNPADGTFSFNRSTAGTVALTVSDDDANAQMSIYPNGTGLLQMGSNTTITAGIYTSTLDSDFATAAANRLTLSSSDGGNASPISLTMRDYAATTDDDMYHSRIFTNCTNTGSGTEECDLTFENTTAGANVTIADFKGGGAVILGDDSSTSMTLDTIGADLVVDDNNNTFSLRSTEGGNTGPVVLEFRDYAATTDDDMAHVLVDANCTDTGSGTEDCDLVIQTTVAGANETRVTIDGDGDISLAGGDVILPVEETATFGAPNAFLADRTNLNQIIGIPKLGVTHGDWPDGTDKSVLFNPAVANCAPITDGTEADDATNYITGSASYQYTAGADAAENEGFDCDVTAGPGNVGTDSIGFWFRTDTALSAGTLDVTLDDGGVAEGNADFPAVSVVDEWQWIEIDFASDCDAACAAIDGFFVQVTAAGEAAAEMDGAIINIDTGGFWLDTAEIAIGDVQVGGVITVSRALEAAGSANNTSALTEGTDYLVNYQSGADALVFITNQALYYGWTLEALD